MSASARLRAPSPAPAARAPRPVRLVHLTTVPVTQWAFLRGQTAYLQARGFEVHAVASPGPLLERLRMRDGVEVHGVEIPRGISPLADLRAAVKLVRLLRRLRPEVAHLSTPKAALLGAVAARLAGVPHRVFLVRGLSSEAERGGRGALYRALERLTARLCTRVLCVSPSLLAYAERAGVLKPGRGRVAGRGMSNGIDTARFDPDRLRDAAAALRTAHGIPADAFVAGFVGRLARDKGIEEIAHAWDRLRERDFRARLLLVGGWESHDAVDPIVRRRLERDPRVVLTGSVDDPAPWYAAMSVLLFPSHGTEGFPNAPMEAAALRVPVVASAVVGCVDAVADQETGRLVPPRDPAALLDAVEQYRLDPELRERHGRAARERVVAGFRNEVVWEAVHAEYAALLGPRLEAAS